MIDDAMLVAYHEAGHATICAVLGVRVLRVTTIPNGEIAGRVTHQKCDGVVNTNCAVLLGGGLAVWELCWRRGAKMQAHCYRDLEKFDTYLRCLGAKNYDPEQRETWDEWKAGERIALEIIGDFWGAIECIAGLLLKRGELNGPTVHAIVAEHKRRAKQIEATK